MRDALDEAVSADAGLDEAFRETAEYIRTGLKLEPDNVSAVRPLVQQGFEQTAFKRRRIIAKVIESGAKKGAPAVRKTFRAKFGAETTRAQLRTSKRAMNEAADRIAGKVTIDHVSLSKRIRKWDRLIGDEMAHVIEKGIKSRKGIEQIAKKIAKLDNVTEGLPKYLQEVEALARAGAPELKKVAKGYIARAKKLLGEYQVDGTRKASPYSLRSPTQKFLRDVQKAGLDGIDSVVREYVENRAAWRAKVIARQETLESYRASYRNNLKGKRGVIGVRHVLSGRHPRADICDYWANINLGIGRGVWPLDQVPRIHVGCLCVQTAVIDEKTFDRETDGVPEEFKDSVSPNGPEWLRANPDKAAAILGPSRHEAFRRGIAVIDDQHQLLPVSTIVGRASRVAAE